MKKLLITLLICPFAAGAQDNLTGMWRLKEKKITLGPPYENAVPLMIRIQQKKDRVHLEIASDLGDRDTLVKEVIYFTNAPANTTHPAGKKKWLSFKKNDKGSGWIKYGEVFSAGANEPELTNTEQFALSADGNSLVWKREYDYRGIEPGMEDMKAEATFEKITAAQLARETATGKGVQFTIGLSWEQVLAKAKKENKYIFVDCYATWCGPCKKMDKNVFPLNRVGEAMNDKFIAVKVQMDTAKNDPPPVQSTYPVARKLETEYSINALPTYLFFTPDGKMVHKAIGNWDAGKFVQLVGQVHLPENQSYTLIGKARNKQLPWSEFPAAINKIREEYGEHDVAKELAELYSNEYLSTADEKIVLSPENLGFFDLYNKQVKTTDAIFKACLRAPRMVDSIKKYEGGGWADYIVVTTINREKVDPVYEVAEKTANEPDWVGLDRELTEQFGREMAITYLLDAKVVWYWRKQQWPQYFTHLLPSFGRHNLDKLYFGYLHSSAWNVFKHSDDKALIKEALKWMDIIIPKGGEFWTPMMMDSKACLLYKDGKPAEGIALLKEAIKISKPDMAEQWQLRISKMEQGEKIWETAQEPN